MVEPEKPAEPNMLEEARAISEGLKATLAEIKTEREKLEQVKSFQILGGKSQGAPQETKPVEVSAKDYAKDVLEGKVKLK